MISELNTKELFASLDKSELQFVREITSFSEKEVNIVPFKDSWTAAQVAAHVAKSIASVAELLRTTAKPANRKPAARVQEIKEMFLDFALKFKSAKNILPAEKVYDKETLTEEVKTAFKGLKDVGSQEDLSEILQLPALGEITKFELLYLSVFHTIRHVHQLKNISKIL